MNSNNNKKLFPEWIKLCIALSFVLIVFLVSMTQRGGEPGQYYLIIAAVIGAYMAINIGANDVANNVGPAVGSKALSLTAAVVIAITFEALGALTAGGEVVDTIKKGIIDATLITDPKIFIWVMMAALISASMWLHTATALSVPVSTTHAIIGGVLGAGIASSGWDIVNWVVMKKIAASWFISPVMGGMVAATLLYYITSSILYKSDRLAAARKVIPLLISLMSWAFITFLLIKGAKFIYTFSIWQAATIGFLISAIIYILTKPIIQKAAQRIPDNSRNNINELFTIPLIISAAVLSFAHGANDVANAVGPLAAINDTVINSGINLQASIPLWVMLIGATGIAVGITVYGPKLIKTVGSNITDINKTRAFCIATAASITVIVASQLGLPVSSTHVAVGAIFGVGFLRELLTSQYNSIIEEVRAYYESEDEHDEQTLIFLERFENASTEDKSSLLKELKQSSKAILTKKQQKKLRKAHKEQLVTRSLFIKIITAWFITVPCSAVLSGLFFFIFKWSFR